jgi:flavin reductase (DIM6/NTAB) family NADH-FMN oxidoreductase RutF
MGVDEAAGGAAAEMEAIDAAMDAYGNRADYPLHVVTTASARGGPSGCVAGFVTQCSIAPPRFLICISKLNHTYFVSEHSDAIALHLIGEDQLEVASLFAEESGDTVDKFAQCDWRSGITGAPVLSECATWWEGTVVDRWSVGDHEALLVRPVTGGAGTGRGLLTVQNAPDFRPGHPATA